MKQNNLVRSLKRGSPLILTILGSIGVVATAVLAAKETPKAIKVLENAKEEKGEELTKLETVVNASRVYIPAATVGACTIMCIFGAHTLNKKQQTTLITAYNALANYHKEYRQTLINLHGEEVDQEVKAEMARRHCDYHQIGLDTPDRKTIWYEEVSQDSIEAYEREIMDAEYHLNRNFTLRGYATLNEWYSFLGLPLTDEGEELGWTMDSGISWIDFEHLPLDTDTPAPSAFCVTPIFSPELLSEYDI